MSLVVLSLNTALDRTLLVPGFVVGEVARARETRIFAGGKGLNVARALRKLGQPVLVVGFLGGEPAPTIKSACTALGIRQLWIETAGASRTCVIVVDPLSGKQTVINESGPTVGAEEVEQLYRAVMNAAGPGSILCISGSAPPGVPDDFYAHLIRALHARKVRVLADVSGEPLQLVSLERPWVLKPNHAEYQAAFGRNDDPVAAVRDLAERADHALLTLGAGGVLYAHGSDVCHFRPPLVRTANAVGSGDALTAGFLAGIAGGMTFTDAIRQGVACGAANAGRFDPEIGDPAEIRELMRQVRLTVPV